MNSSPAPIVTIMIARGTVRRESFASSESVETESNPRNDRHRIAAPWNSGPTPATVPSPVNGSSGFTWWPVADPTVSTTNATMKIGLHGDHNEVRAGDRHDADDFRIVTITTAAMIHTAFGIAGNVWFR